MTRPLARLVFISTGDAARGPIAAAAAASVFGSTLRVESFGVRPASPHPDAARILLEHHLDLSAHLPRGLGELSLEGSELFILLSPEASAATGARGGRVLQRWYPPLDGASPAQLRCFRDAALALSWGLARALSHGRLP